MIFRGRIGTSFVNYILSCSFVGRYVWYFIFGIVLCLLVVYVHLVSYSFEVLVNIGVVSWVLPVETTNTVTSQIPVSGGFEYAYSIGLSNAW